MIKLLAVVLFSWAGVSHASEITLNPARTIEIKGAVNVGILLKADQLMKLSAASDDPIDILINSPGGYVLPGMQFVQAIRIAKHRGVTVRCVVPMAAASMAFIIFNECSERYAMPNAYLLWHGVRVGIRGNFTTKKLMIIVRSMQRIGDVFDEKLRATLGLSKRVFYYHYNNDSWIPASTLNKMTGGTYLNLVDDINGYKGSVFSMSRYSNAKPIDSIVEYIGPLQ